MHGKHVSHQGPKLVMVTRLHFNVALLLTTKHTHTLKMGDSIQGNRR